MQIRCTHCTKTIALVASGDLPASCPHCARPPGPGTLGEYEPIRLIATGGMGEVWLARHRELGTEVALKVLPAMPLDTIASVRERFAREARLTARVRHQGVVKIHGNDVAGDRPYLVLEFVAGRTLREALHDGPLPVVEAARIAAATAAVLAAAHAEGVLHRDVKPDNVMVAPDGSVRVLDFGIARAVQDDAPITRTGEIVGTPEYMAPEQLLDGPESTTERTDVHALGVLSYELLTSRSPFHGANVFQALKLVESLVPQPPSALRPGVPAALDAAVLRALQKDPVDRFATADDFRRAIEAAVPEAAVPRETPRTSWRTLLAVSLASALIAAVLLVVVIREFVLPALTATASVSVDLTTAAQALKNRHEIRELLADGRWWRAAQLARTAIAAGDPLCKELAQDAFLLSHHAWFLAASAPPWLARCDEHERRALFGDASETTAPEEDPRVLLANGDAAGAVAVLRARRSGGTDLDRDSRRLLTLAEHVLGTPAPSPDPDDALTRLLERRSPAVLAAFAARLPVDEPEHWLAQRCAAGTNFDNTRLAAQNAWSYGGGEVAVLLDAILHAMPDAANGRVALCLPANADTLRRRLSFAPADDSPASAVFVALLDALRGEPSDLTFVRKLPAAVGDAAAAWLGAAGATTQRPEAMQRLSEALRGR